MANRINSNFKRDYAEFLGEYLLPMLGIDLCGDQKKLDDKEEYVGTSKQTIYQENNKLHFVISGWKVFSVPCKMTISDDNMAVARRIVQEFPDIAEYKMTGSARNLPSGFSYKAKKQALFRSAIQDGICRWIAGDQNSGISKLFDELETWAVKTYEGKRVTMGFVINPEASSFHIGNQQWLQFLHDDASATLTDCIHSVVELDADCNFVTYHSLSEGDRIFSCKLNYKTPLRFSQIIQTQITDKKRGVFLLNNGDIILSKNQEVCFVRRNLRWLNLSYNAFRNALDPFFVLTTENSERKRDSLEKLLQSIFASVLDVSFSHAGGIIAVVGQNWPGSKITADGVKDPILAACDDLIADTYQIDEHSGDIRALKRTVLKELISGKKFTKLDRKLRGELLGLDGACILKCDGTVQSFGAIIQNDSGSLGGGRGAAARKLSEYGMAVKISTDGYIEVYVSGELVYAIK